MEYMVLPVRKDVSTSSREKVGRPTFFEIDLKAVNSPRELNEELKSRILKHYGRSLATKTYLILPTDDADVLTIRPTYSAEHQPFNSYRNL